MFNVLLDKLPTEYKGFPIDSDFQTGIQIMQVLEDEELSQQEQIDTSLSLLFLQTDKELDVRTAVEGLIWFLTDWNHDKNKTSDKEKVTDYDVDQWRIYSGFQQHYGINLNTARLHFWEFMGLLTTLPECAYTRVIDIRSKKITSKMGKDERKAYTEMKKVYALEQPEEVKYTDSQKQAIDDFDRMMEEQKKIRESKRLALEAGESVDGYRNRKNCSGDCRKR